MTKRSATTTAPLVHPQQQQATSAPPPASTPKAAHHGKSIIPLVAGLPVVLVIVTVVVVLLLVLVWLNYKSKRDQAAAAGGEYQKLPTEEIGPVLNLPYPTGTSKPRIKMMDPPIPGTTTEFVEAAQLGAYPTSNSRYPFTDTDRNSSSSQSTDRGQGMGKKRTRRYGSRRAAPLDVKFRSSDRSSGSEDSMYSGSPRVPASPASRSAAVTPPPSPTIVRRGSVTPVVDPDKKKPELFLSLFYKENEAVLRVRVERAVSLPFRQDGTPVDAYVRLFFIPNLPDLPQRRTSKTRTQRSENTPVFNEEVEYEAMSMEELINSTLHVEVLDFRSYGKHIVLGQADIALVQVQFIRGEASITLPLKSPKVRENLGTVLVSICYSPETKKLGVIILRAKDLNKGNSQETDAQAKIWITLGGDRILGRMRTKKKPQSCSPIFNEALTCSVEPAQVRNTAVNIALLNESRQCGRRELGQVILCGQCSGEEFRHWNDVMATPGKHIAEWHELR